MATTYFALYNALNLAYAVTDNTSLPEVITQIFNAMCNNIIADKEQSISDFHKNRDKGKMADNFKPLSECDVVIEEFKQACKTISESDRAEFEKWLTHFSNAVDKKLSVPSFVVESFPGAKCYQIGDD
jgi:hypothetical protein